VIGNTLEGFPRFSTSHHAFHTFGIAINRHKAEVMT
jgi:hypothetical protein